VTVDGEGSAWMMTQSLQIGFKGNGTLLIQNVGSVSDTPGIVGDDAGSIGQVTVSGIGSTWTNSTDLFIGGSFSSNGGTGTVNIGPGGTVSAGGFTRLFDDGQVNLQGGTFSTDSFEDQGGIFNWVSGTVNLTNPAGFTLGTGEYEFGNAALALHENQSFSVTGPLTIPGTGQLSTLGGDLNAGSAEIQSGGLMFLSGGSHDFGTGLTNNSSLVLNNTTVASPVTSPAGSDITILGNVTFNDLVSGAGGFFGPGTAIFNGGHNPGDSPAEVPVEGSLVYGGTNTLTIELGGLLSGEFDQLDVEGDVTLDGDLALDILPGFTPNQGDQFEIFDIAGTLSGQFAGLGQGALIAAGGGQEFQISYTGGIGGNSVVLTAVPEPGTFVLGIVGLVIVGMWSRARRLENSGRPA